MFDARLPKRLKPSNMLVNACHLKADARAEVARNPVLYEQPGETVNVSIDDVVVKHQKLHRANRNQEPDIVAHEEASSGWKYVHNSLVHIQHQEHSYCIA